MKQGLLASIALVALAAPAWAQTDPLADGFRDPPASARPRTWWHWLGGNITEEGIDRDLEWMKAAGLGGVQTFDVSLGTPQLVEKRLAYMTPAWKHAFNHAVATADRLGLELAIASSPGWSESGGPWVAPADAMKKLVWSTTDIVGGRRFAARLAAPPTVTGPYGTAAYSDPLNAAPGAPAPPAAGGDVAVIAYPLAADPAPRPTSATAGDGAALDVAALSDDDERTTAALAVTGEPVVALAYPRPTEMRAATLFVPGIVSPFAGAKYLPVLEAESGGGWRKVAELPLDNVPTTVAFAPVTAARFRVRFAANPHGGTPDLAPPAPGAQVVNIFPDTAAKTLGIATLRLDGAARTNRFEAKAGFATVPDYYALAGGDDVGAVAKGRVVDLTGRLRPDGSLDWTPPAGRWRVLRFGWSLLGTTNHPATAEATGLEVDKFDAAAVRRYLDRYFATYDGARGIKALVTDSIEAGNANWTPAMVADFRRLRGYDPTPWLPAIAGAVIGSRAETDAFLYDYRRTIADLIASEHYGTVAAVARAKGLTLYGEALEDKRPQLGDDLAMRRFTNVPMAAMWAFTDEGGPRPTLVGDILGAASVAHVYGQNLVAAESFTSAFAPWAFGPAELKPIADLEFVLGVNRPVVHTSPHSPMEGKEPGLSLAIFGQAFDRHETWAGMARSWVDYLARTGFLLQQGRHVADIAYFVGEEAPLTQLYADGRLTLVPTTNGFDFVGADVVREGLRVEGAAIVAPSGDRYRALFLGGTSSRMTLPVLERVAALAEAGATVIGKAPNADPSRGDDAARFRLLVARLWPGGNEANVGRGRVIATGDLAAGLARAGIAPDVAAEGATTPGDLLFQHRALADGSDVYFIHNRATAAQRFTARLRVGDRRVEVWHADSGRAETIAAATDHDRTDVHLSIAGRDSVMLVLRPMAAPAAPVSVAFEGRIAAPTGPWRVSFEAGRGAPASTTMAALMPLDRSSEPGIRYFSGVATYTTTLSVPAAALRQPLALDLGRVGDVAEVRVNGTLVGTTWHAPYRLPLGKAVHAGTNTLDIRVADLWHNRLIGDAQPGAAKVAFVAAPTYQPDAPLRPAGLIGPVAIVTAAR